jgi:hypothetical protein
MNTTVMRLSVGLAALLVGCFTTAYRYHGAAIDAYLHTSHLHVMDWVLLLFGSLFCVGSLPYQLWTQPDTIDWRGAFWFVVGAFMIYAALGNNPTLKEAACRIFSHPRVHTQPCYYQ